MPAANAAPDPINRTPFDRWCWERDLGNAAVGQRLRCTSESARRYRLPFGDPGRRIPDEATLREVFVWTEGEITPNDFHELPEAARAAGGAR